MKDSLDAYFSNSREFKMGFSRNYPWQLLQITRVMECHVLLGLDVSSARMPLLPDEIKAAREELNQQYKNAEAGFIESQVRIIEDVSYASRHALTWGSSK